MALFSQQNNASHIGIIFNIHSDTDYDIIYFRKHKIEKGISSTGLIPIRNGLGVESLDHNNCTFDFTSWNSVTLSVLPDSTKVYINRKLDIVVPRNYTLLPKARAGVMTFNGYVDTIMFRNFKIV